MELRQLRYFVRVVELGSMGRAAADLGVVVSALSQQIARLEHELQARLLQRSAAGVRPTDAGLAFLRQAQLALRHADDAALAARQARLSGHVSVGLAPSTASVLAMPLLQAMRERFPDVRLRLVESLSGELAAMLNARQLDLCVLFEGEPAQRWRVRPLLDERLYAIGAHGLGGMPRGPRVRLAELARLPLVLPSGTHGLRATVNAAFAAAGLVPQVVLEVDGLAVLLQAVAGGLGATVQPAAALAAASEPQRALLRTVLITDRGVRRRNVLASLPDEELSPAALATRQTLRDAVGQLVADGLWPGATLHDS